MKKSILLIGSVLFVLSGCNEKTEIVTKEQEPEQTEVSEEVVKDIEKEEEEDVEKDSDDVMIIEVNGEKREIESYRDQLNGNDFSIKLPKSFEIDRHPDGDMIGGTGTYEEYYISIRPTSRSVKGHGMGEVMSGNDYPVEMDIEKYPKLKEKYEYYFQNDPRTSKHKIFSFVRAYKEGAVSLTIYIPLEELDDEKIAMAEGIAAGFIIK